jgi:hypothetical protein
MAPTVGPVTTGVITAVLVLGTGVWYSSPANEALVHAKVEEIQQKVALLEDKFESSVKKKFGDTFKKEDVEVDVGKTGFGEVQSQIDRFFAVDTSKVFAHTLDFIALSPAVLILVCLLPIYMCWPRRSKGPGKGHMEIQVESLHVDRLEPKKTQEDNAPASPEKTMSPRPASQTTGCCGSAMFSSGGGKDNKIFVIMKVDTGGGQGPVCQTTKYEVKGSEATVVKQLLAFNDIDLSSYHHMLSVTVHRASSKDALPPTSSKKNGHEQDDVIGSVEIDLRDMVTLNSENKADEDSQGIDRAISKDGEETGRIVLKGKFVPLAKAPATSSASSSDSHHTAENPTGEAPTQAVE